MRTTATFYSLEYNSARTYLLAAVFVVGNILLPQLCHQAHLGGPTWLPIYFFTLVGAYKYGWRVGLLTAIASPLANSLFFGMPSAALLPAILLKSSLLAGIAGIAASRCHKVTVPLLLAVVLGYQALGTLGEWLIIGDLYSALQDFRLGIPGMLLQVFGGYCAIKAIR